MGNLKKSQIFVAAALSFGLAYGQSVVIDGANIRVDASPTGKAAATVKTDKNTVVNKSKNGVVVGNGATTASNAGSTASVVSAGKGSKVLVNTDISGQDLSRGNYAGASFTNVEAVGTNFKGVDLSKAVMTNVDLSKADLRGANLSGGQMTNVDWEGALLDGAIWMDGRRCGPASIGRCM